jgi:hypothetical protein
MGGIRELSEPDEGSEAMKTILITLAVIVGVVTVAIVALPNTALACQAGDPGC